MTDAERENYERVFGFDVTFDENGTPNERGIGSPSQKTVHPTNKRSLAVKPEQIEFVRKCVAAANSPILAKEFEAFLRWRERDAINRAAVVEVPVNQIVNSGLAQPQKTDEQKVNLYRQKLRAGLLAPPIQVSVLSTNLYRVVNGWHRLSAARLEHRQYIRCEIVPDITTDSR
jgi:hypothetical protein